MNRQKRKNGFGMTIAVKMNLFFMLLVLIPIVFITALVSYMTYDSVKNRIQSGANQYLNQSIERINNNISELNNIMISILQNNDLQEVLSGEGNYLTTPDEKQYIRENLRNISNTRKDIAFIMIVTEKQEKISYLDANQTEDFQKMIRIDKSGWNQEDFERYQKGQTVWTALEEYPGYLLGVRQLRNFSNLDTLGEIYVVLENDTIKKQYQDLKITDGSFFVVRDSLGNLISSDYREGPSEENITGLLPENAYRKIGGIYYYVSFLKDQDLGFEIYSCTPRKEMLEDLYFFVGRVICIACLVIGILLILMYHFSKSITKPIYTLQNSMQEVQRQNLDVKAPVDSRDELGSLAETFNDMTQRIKELIEKEYQSQILLQESEYRFLRAQINPHFLYNTLDSIKWMAVLGGNEDVGRMAVALGRIFRWAISNTDTMVSLEDELSVLDDYMFIQKIRYGEKLVFEKRIPEAFLACMVPKMILQPLVENALTHGLEEKDGEKHLSVTAGYADNELQITVADDGVGMTKERMEQIMSPEWKPEKAHGIGIQSVHKRIVLSCGAPYGLEIESELSKGTAIRLHLPFMEEKDL